MNNKWWMFFKELFLFTFFTGVFYVISICISGDWLPKEFKPNLVYMGGGNLNSRLKDLTNYKDVDVLFLGSSHAYRSFDTRIFEREGIRCFNLGSNYQSHIQTELLIDRHLDYLNPKVVVYEVYIKIFLDDGVESALDVISNSQIDAAAIKIAFEHNHMKIYNTLLYAFYRQSIGEDFYEDPSWKSRDTYIPGGFVMRNEVSYFKERNCGSFNQQILPEQYEAFSRVLEKLKRKGVNVILVQTPVTSSWYQCFNNTDEFDNLMKRSGKYYNFNSNSKMIDSLHFMRDGHHFNQIGVNVFCRDFLEILKPIILIADNK